ncbi:MAG: GTP 3',8-cyclase MoaA [Acidimicrobiia bacterium]|jgi:cyclic pyranopterin phosphate synthase|nr:GTP 3',8-cyclase MoaA [Acidimicrobiia bacterium]
MLREPLVDTFGRVHRDLRISVTDRCNFRCTYCMPAEGMEWLPRQEVLTFEEIERVARVCVERFGFGSIRLTGGEPTVRARLSLLVAKLAALRGPAGPVDIALTTNGATLELLADGLVAAGLRRINVSLDTLRPERFLALTRRDALGPVLAGIDAAVRAGLDPVKVNCVLMRGVNDDEVVDLARYGRDHGVTVRFIEFMPLDASGGWADDQVVPAAEIVARIDEVFPLEPVSSAERGSEPAARWRYRDGRGELGVIPAVSEAFCASCDRVRLTADGQLRSCLFASEETDLRGPLRAGASDGELADLLRTTVAGKWAGHGVGTVTFIRPKRSMSQIGG